MKLLLLIVTFFIVLINLRAQNCPPITITHTPYINSKTTFTAAVKGAAFYDLSYNWVVNKGKIISGQGTYAIQVSLDGEAATSIIATLVLGGLPSTCGSEESDTALVNPAPTRDVNSSSSKIDEVYTTTEAVEAAVKRFVQQTGLTLSKLPDVAYIFVYRGPSTTPAEFNKIKGAIEKAFGNNGVTGFSYVMKDGGKRKHASYEIYYVKGGKNPPEPSKDTP